MASYNGIFHLLISIRPKECPAMRRLHIESIGRGLMVLWAA